MTARREAERLTMAAPRGVQRLSMTARHEAERLTGCATVQSWAAPALRTIKSSPWPAPHKQASVHVPCLQNPWFPLPFQDCPSSDHAPLCSSPYAFTRLPRRAMPLLRSLVFPMPS
eukprot:293572-Chlamydomonas_euryale.AAC.1